MEEIGDRRFPLSNMDELIHVEGLSYMAEISNVDELTPYGRVMSCHSWRRLPIWARQMTNDKFTDMGEAMRCHVSYVLYGIMNNEETYDL